MVEDSSEINQQSQPPGPAQSSLAPPQLFARPQALSQPQCSAKACRAAAVWQLHWNNPKIHTPDRRKTWLACTDHRQSLGTFLKARGFLREVTPFASSGDAVVS